jgi:hypothetical protein
MGASTTHTVTAQTAVATKYTRDTGSNSTYSTASSGATTLTQIRVNNTSGSQDTYTKGYNNAGPTVGTTAPGLQIKCPAGKSAEVTCLQGVDFATALTFATTTEKGTAGTTSPTTAPTAILAHT